VDFYRPFLKKDATAAEQVRFSRWMTVIWGVALVGLAIMFLKVSSVLEAGLTIAGITGGSMLGVFLLGVLTKKASEKGSILGMIAGLMTMLAVWKSGTIPYTWYVLIGTVITFSIGYAASRIFQRT
jgi:solute:Na+ symporter, SSS family